MRLFYLIKSTKVGKTTDFTCLYNYYNNSKNSNISFEHYELQEITTKPTNDDFT